MATIDDRLGKLEDIVTGQESQLMLLASIAERQQVTLERQVELLEEVRRDAAQTQRLWVNLCKKYGWLDDTDLP